MADLEIGASCHWVQIACVLRSLRPCLNATRLLLLVSEVKLSLGFEELIFKSFTSVHVVTVLLSFYL